MFFPIRDDQPSQSKPVVNYFIIALNIFVYLFLELPVQGQGQRAFEVLTFQFGLIPQHFTRALEGSHQYGLPATLLTILTSMFLHGDFFHILFNLWFLWIFGDNVEDNLGHFPYLVFYLVCGFAAAFADIALSPASRIPTIGASGAIAGVMGAYILLYPRARVLTLVFMIFIFFWWLPAWVYLGFWFLGQLVSTSMVATQTQQSGGVAFAAHVGGFIAGLVLIKLFPQRARSYRYGS